MSQSWASDGSYLGTYGIGTCSGIAFDGANIWAVADGVTELNASNGSVIGRYTGFGGGGGIAFDGANIWVMGIGDDVTKVNVSDGSVVGMYPGGGGGGLGSAIAFDGANIG